MIQKNPANREVSFSKIKQRINQESTFYIPDSDRDLYMKIADLVTESIDKLYGFDFLSDDEAILQNLFNLLKRARWEKTIKNIPVVNCFFSQIDAEYNLYRYDDYGNIYGDIALDINDLKDFVDMFQKLSHENRLSLIENLHYNRMALIPISKRTVIQDFAEIDDDGDLPF